MADQLFRLTINTTTLGVVKGTIDEIRPVALRAGLMNAKLEGRPVKVEIHQGEPARKRAGTRIERYVVMPNGVSVEHRREAQRRSPFYRRYQQRRGRR